MDRGSDSDETFTQAVVRLSVANPAPSKELPDPFAGLWFAIVQAIDGRDLDAHIAMLILRSSSGCVEPTLELLSRKLAEGVSFDSGLSRSKDVAIMGAQLALNIQVSNLDHFDRAVRRELARQPLPPLACIHDDERLLIGVAAGIGKACPVLSSELVRVLRSRPHPNSIRQNCVDLWAESLSCGEDRFSTKVAERGVALLRASMSKGSSITPEDCVLLCWLANRLLESEWSPRREELEAVLEFVDGQAYSLRGLIALLGTVTPVDAAFLLSLQSLPSLRTAKRGVSLILDIIDGFPASASVLSRRQAHLAASQAASKREDVAAESGQTPVGETRGFTKRESRLDQQGRESEPNEGGRGSLLSKYRSGLKRGILIQLTKNPRATDVEICRALDADGSIELPVSWKGRKDDRSFVDAYLSASLRRRVEVAISKVRADLRKEGLLAPC